MPTPTGRLATELAIVRSCLRTPEICDDASTYKCYIQRERALMAELRKRYAPMTEDHQTTTVSHAIAEICRQACEAIHEEQ